MTIKKMKKIAFFVVAALRPQEILFPCVNFKKKFGFVAIVGVFCLSLQQNRKLVSCVDWCKAFDVFCFADDGVCKDDAAFCQVECCCGCRSC